MKKELLILATVLMVAVLFQPFSTVSAESNAPIVCMIDMAFDIYPDGQYWYGTVSGCSLEGTIRFDADPEKPAFDVGLTRHFFEIFTLYPNSGGVIHGKNAGVWEVSNFKFRANGWILDASPEWTHLVGNKYFEMGQTSDPTQGLPITAPDTLIRLAPAR